MKRLLVGALLPFLAACSSGSSGASASRTSLTTPATSAVSSTAAIVTLDVPASVRCGSATSTMVPVGYTVTGSVRRELNVDGLPGPDLAKEKGVVRAPVHCDDLQHTAVLVAVDARGAETTRTKMFATVTGAR